MADNIKPEDLLARAREDYVMSMPGEPSPADAADFDAMVERGFMIESKTIVYGWKGTPKDGFVSVHADLNGQVDALRFFESQVARIGKTGLPDYQPHITKVERMIRVVSTWHTTAVEEEPSSTTEEGTQTRFVASHMLLPGDVVRRVMGPRGDDIIVEVERPPVTDQAPRAGGED